MIFTLHFFFYFEQTLGIHSKIQSVTDSFIKFIVKFSHKLADSASSYFVQVHDTIKSYNSTLEKYDKKIDKQTHKWTIFGQYHICFGAFSTKTAAAYWTYTS